MLYRRMTAVGQLVLVLQNFFSSLVETNPDPHSLPDNEQQGNLTVGKPGACSWSLDSTAGFGMHGANLLDSPLFLHVMVNNTAKG
jgi:hypothetical protein